MLDFGFSEILLTSAIALVVLGPERLPKVARQVGNWMGRARAMARQLSEQLEREVSAEELLREQTKPKAAPMTRLTAPAYTPPDPYASQFDPRIQPAHDTQTAATTESLAAADVDRSPPPVATPADPTGDPGAARDTGPHAVHGADPVKSPND